MTDLPPDTAGSGQTADPPALAADRNMVVLMRVRLNASEATVPGVAHRFHIGQDAVDAAFGVVVVDPAKNTYAIKVTESAAEVIEKTDDSAHRQNDPQIVPFGTEGTVEYEHPVGEAVRKHIEENP